MLQVYLFITPNIPNKGNLVKNIYNLSTYTQKKPNFYHEKR